MGENETLVDMDERLQQQEKNNKYNVMLFFTLFRKIMTVCDGKEIDVEKINLWQDFHKDLPIEILNSLKIEGSTRARSQLKNTIRAELLNVLFEKCQQNRGDSYDLCFFAAVNCNKKVLKENICCCSRDTLNTPRYSDTILTFTLKHGNISEADFFDCVDLLLEAGIDINKPDFNGDTAVEHVAFLYKRNNCQEEIKRQLEQLIDKLKQKGILWELLKEETRQLMDMPTESEQHEYSDYDTINQLFCWIGKMKIEEFLKFENIRQFVDSDNGESTLLQFACKKSGKMHAVVKFLLEKGANPNKITEIYTMKPLEIAVRKKKHERSFEEILKNKKLQITEEMFSHFAKWYPAHVKRKHFEMFLESDKLEAKFICQKTGNTPLHYAVRFTHKKAIQKLLKQPENVLDVINEAGKDVLDTIRVDDLKAHFDACLALDNYNDFGSEKYKMQLRFKSLVSSSSDEIKIISKIAKNKNLRELLTHPLLHTFLVLKWSKVTFYHRLLVILQLFLFITLSPSFYVLCEIPSTTFWTCVFLVVVNFVIKIPFIVAPYFCGKRQRPTLYEIIEILLMLTLIGAFFQIACRAFAFVEMSVLFLLTVGYHPKIAKWSAMLKKVFQSFIYLMLFFSVILVAFAVAFLLLFKDKGFFENFWTSLFVTYIMTTGELNMNENFVFSTAGHYLIFFFFAIFVALVMVNFWIGIAVSDISSIEKNAEINAFKNVITFLEFVEKLFRSRRLARFLPLPNPLLFFFDDKNKYNVNFYVNAKEQFKNPENSKKQSGDCEGLPENVGSECLDKIKRFFSEQTDSSNDKFVNRLEQQEKMLLEIQSSINSLKEHIFQKENKKNRKEY
ncbi:hypothetical protein Zmor_024692 [Zophobas morio]|uniref:Ion transport domain-containing protein n=1 Tax=Zophobas morio TaxID=2755281 RepID=A0AA38HYW7_9CUCU|nr:hypothetical protein Zmor_024692 [Zophobas morio]